MAEDEIVLTPEVREYLSQLEHRLSETPYGDVGIVFTMSGGKVSLIKPINLPVIKPRNEHAKS